MKLPLLSYLPDIDTTQQGVVTDLVATLPSFNGYEAAPTPANTLLAALAAECIGAASLKKLDGSNRFFAGTAVRLYEAGATTWTDRSAGAPTDYTTVTNRWRFAQFGNVSIAASKENLLQSSTAGAFAAIATSIKADIVETVGEFVMCFNTDDTGGVGTEGDRPHSWWCSGIGNQATWTPAIATQAATGELTSVPGRVTAGKRFGDQIVAYKENGLYIGHYAGPPFIWEWDLIPSDGGTWCQESVISIGTTDQPKHFYVGTSDFYLFEGSRPQAIGDGIKKAFFNDLNGSEAEKICLSHDSEKSLIRIFYPSGSSTTIDSCIVWNYKTGKWGRDDRIIEFATQYVQPSITYDDLGTYYSTYADLPASLYDDAFSSFASGEPIIFNSSHRLQTFSGLPGNGRIVTGDYGDDERKGLLHRVKPMWLRKPTSATMQSMIKESLGDSLTNGVLSTMSNSRFDALAKARWHRLQFDMVGDFELNKIDVKIRGGGDE